MPNWLALLIKLHYSSFIKIFAIKFSHAFPHFGYLCDEGMEIERTKLLRKLAFFATFGIEMKWNKAQKRGKLKHTKRIPFQHYIPLAQKCNKNREKKQCGHKDGVDK